MLLLLVITNHNDYVKHNFLCNLNYYTIIVGSPRFENRKYVLCLSV